MDIGTGITGLAFLAFCIIVFLLMARNGRKKEKALLKALEKLAAATNCQLGEYDSWQNRAIAIDKEGAFVFAIQHVDGNKTPSSILLAGLKSCKLLRTLRNESNNQGVFSEILKLDLLLDFKDKAIPASTINFYFADVDGHTLNGELQLIEKWNRVINDKLAAVAAKK